MSPGQTLGTLLRALVAHLDGAVEQAYACQSLDYKPRYTPIVRAILALGPTTIQAITLRAGVSQPAVSQTLTEMVRRDLVTMTAGRDARERIIALTPKAESMLPQLEEQWAATRVAAESLTRDLGISLEDVLQRALDHLAQQSFADRIAEARHQIASIGSPSDG